MTKQILSSKPHCVFSNEITSQFNGDENKRALYVNLFDTFFHLYQNMNKFLKFLSLSSILLIAQSTHGQISSNLSFTMSSGPTFPVDANACSSGAIPQAHMIGIESYNSGSTEINVGTLSLDSLPSGWTLLGPISGSKVVGKLTAGQKKYVYYYLKPNCSAKGTTVKFRFKANNGSNIQYYRPTVDVIGVITAAAGASISSKIAGLDVIGAIIRDTVNFSYGNFDINDILLASGTSMSSFKTNLLELTNVKTLAVSNSNIGYTVGKLGYTYGVAGFKAVGNNSYTAQLEFVWRVIGKGDSTRLVPFCANEAAGGYKGLSGDTSWASGKAVIVSNNSTISVSKSCNKSKYQVGDTLTYQIKLSNSSTSANVEVDEIIDTLPSNFSFIVPGSTAPFVSFIHCPMRY